MPKRIQRKCTKGWRMPENTVYVGRGSRWENPFVVGKDGTVEECINKYIEWLFPYTHGGTLDQFLISEMNLKDINEQLRGKDLACWCAEGAKCHADLLLKIANE